jgi:AbrB family looped-hinge helix DNA binding protein
MNNRVSSKGQVTIPKEARKSLGLEPGDEVAFELATGNAVILRRVDPHDFAYYVAVCGSLGEWDSEADTEAFRNL